MNIIILGAGDTGKFLAQNLSQKGHGVTVIDASESLVTSLGELLDIATLCGDGSEASVLAEANVGETGLFIALTHSEHVNLIAASLAKAMGARKTIARVNVPIQSSQWLFNYQTHFNIDYLFSSERLTGAELSKYFLNPESHAIEQIGRGRTKIQQVLVSPASKLLGVPLNKLPLPSKVRIAVIHRRERAIIPKGYHELEANDSVILFGQQARVDELAQSLKAENQQTNLIRVTIYGGSDYGLALAMLLQGSTYRVRILEEDPRICAALAKKLSHVVVVQGDGRSAQLLAEEQIEKADFYIGATLEDENNVMACLQAKNMGVPHVIPIIHNQDNSTVVEQNLDRLGFLATVSPRRVGLLDLVRFVESREFHSMGKLSPDVELVQFTLDQDAGVAGWPLHDLEWPEGSTLVTILRDDHVIVPTGEETIEAGDSLYAAVLPEAKKPLLKLLTR